MRLYSPRVPREHKTQYCAENNASKRIGREGWRWGGGVEGGEGYIQHKAYIGYSCRYHGNVSTYLSYSSSSLPRVRSLCYIWRLYPPPLPPFPSPAGAAGAKSFRENCKFDSYACGLGVFLLYTGDVMLLLCGRGMRSKESDFFQNLSCWDPRTASCDWLD